MEPPKSDAGAEHEELRDPFLSGAPRSGEFSTFAQKLFGEIFVLFASLVVFGSTLNVVAVQKECGKLCSYAIAVAVISVLTILVLMFGHYVTWSSKMDRNSWFNSNAEKNAMIFLVLWWAAGVGGLSAVVTEPCPLPPNIITALNITEVNSTVTTEIMQLLCQDVTNSRKLVQHASGIGVFFGWLAFFGSIYTTFKAYHSSKEEQRAMNFAQHFPYNTVQEEEEHYANF